MKNSKKTLHGFTETQNTLIPELSCTLRMMEHEKTGARLAFLDREDRNMTFSIAFRTPPEDDTGVFHIIEHSVLCGSDKYPVKEPFVELLKGSLSTFLNAMTYEDRTVYPVSSRCEADFYNLASVYLDAVFHPAMLKDERIFMQEGGHLEYEDGALSFNGVVYNEMKGAYSSPDELSLSLIKRTLFKDSPYEYDSGGAPSAIPSLTYEKFKEMHSRYYHPSNAYIFLDGALDLDKTLSLIDSYLSEYEKREINIEFPKHDPIDAGRSEIEYEASESEAGEGKVRLVLAYVFGDFADRTEDSAIGLLESVLAGSNEAPLKKAILDSRLAEDLSVYVSKSRENTVIFELHGVRPEDTDAAETAFYQAIEKIVKCGIDRERLDATVSNMEFKLRESDFGSFPKGVAYALSAYSSWIYGFDPSPFLGFEDVISELKALSSTDYYERLLSRMILENSYRMSLVMKPSVSAGERTAKEESERMLETLSAMSEADISQIEAKKASLDEWQNTPDSEENLNTLPTLSLSDVSAEPELIPSEGRECDGALVLTHSLDTQGITYITMHFSDGSLTEREAFLLFLASQLYKNMPTSRHTALSLQSAVKSTLGSLSFSVQGLSRVDDPQHVKPTLSVSASLLDSKRESAVELIGEILNKTLFSDKEVLLRILTQLRSIMEDSFSSDALSFAMLRVGAQTSAAGKLSELTGGIEAYRTVKDMLRDYDGSAHEILLEIRDVLAKVITKSNLALAVCGNPCHVFEDKLLSLIPSATPTDKSWEHSPSNLQEGISIPSPVGYAVLGGINDTARRHLGALRVVRSLLSYEYLWSEVRVKGGAYGTGFVSRKSGELSFYSYRDPSPASSVEAFRAAPQYLRALAASECDLTKFIIGAFGEYDALMTPRTKSSAALRDALIGWSVEDELAFRRDMLAFSSGDLLCVADIIEETLTRSALAVAIGKDSLDRLALDTVIVP